MIVDGNLGWILGLAAASVTEDRREIADRMGWPRVTPGLRKVIESPEDDEPSYTERDINVMRVCLAQLRGEDYEAWLAVSFHVEDLAWAPVDLARGAKWLLAEVTKSLDNHNRSG